jgi:hypothetical protein
VLGFAVGNSSQEYLWGAGPLSVSTPDDVHHLLLGTILLAGGTLPRTGFRLKRASPNASIGR